MDFVKREDQNVVDEENYKVYMETLQKSHQIEAPEYQHTPISMEQLHQAMQSSLNAGTLMHNLQLPLSPRQMSTLMLKTNHLSRNLNFNEIPAHLQRNLELDLVHNLAEMPSNIRHEDLVLSRNLDLNLARSLSNEIDLQNGLTQNLVQNLNENLGLHDVALQQNLRNDIPHDLSHEIDLSHHLNRNLEQQDILHGRRTLMQSTEQNQMLDASLQRLDQTLGQRLDQTLAQRLDQTLGQRLDQTLAQRLDQTLAQRLVSQNVMHDSQKMDNEHLLPMPFHIKSEQEDDGYFYETINQPLPNVNGIDGHITQDQPAPNASQEQMYVYNNHLNIPALNNVDIYPRTQNYPQNFRDDLLIYDNPQNLVIHRSFDNASPYEEPKKEVQKNENKNEPKENLKPTDQNKMYFQECYDSKIDNQKEDVSFDIKGEYNCYKCNVVFTSKRLLKQHSKTCSENDDENNEKLGKFSCTQCSYRCQAPATLKIHERTHSGEKPYSCTFCEYRSGQKNNVAKHILVHMKEKPYRCQYCDYRCAQKNNLVVHERTHTGYKPFGCPYCEYRTVQKPNLVKHMYLHTNQKPYSCDICTYKCVQKTNLTKHKQRHMNEKEGEKVDVKTQIKPYRPRQKSVKCPHCPYRCVQKASLEKHIVFKHSEIAKEEGLNLMKTNENCEEEIIQNLSVKRDGIFESVCQDVVKESMQLQS